MFSIFQNNETDTITSELNDFKFHQYDYNYISRNKKNLKDNNKDNKKDNNKDNKTITKMLNKKMSRQITKKHYSNIFRKMKVYNF